MVVQVNKARCQQAVGETMQARGLVVQPCLGGGANIANHATVNDHGVVFQNSPIFDRGDPARVDL